MKTLVLALILAILSPYATGAYISVGKSPPGVIIGTAATSCPTYTVPLDGSSLARAGTYAALFAAIGTTYGTVDGSHFTVPNAQGVFLRGAGSQTISSIAHVGTQGTTQNDQFQGHFHSLAHYVDGAANMGSVGSTPPFDALQFGGSRPNTDAVNVKSPVTDGSNGTPRTGAESRPANISVLYCMWY